MTASGSEPHVPVLLGEVLDHLAPANGEILIDGTFGNGGYTRAILAVDGARVVAIDRDPAAISAGGILRDQFADRLTLVAGRFSGLDACAQSAGFNQVDGVVLDVGVSSMQIDQAGRGFSFRADGPLDMRMEQAGASAADVVNQLPAKDLARIFSVLGEERRANAIARAIAEDRIAEPFTGTLQLAGLVERVVGRREAHRIHPATRTFQALRIFVNRELEELAAALAAAERCLREGGRLVVVAFHSLEDRIVKRFFADRTQTIAGGSRHRPQIDIPDPTFLPLTKRPVTPSEAEAQANPRARSARLRAGRRTASPARAIDLRQLGLPRLPDLESIGSAS